MMTSDEVADKLRGGADFAKWDKAKTEAIVAIVRELEHMKTFSELAPLLRN
jgi:hypothetical protein